MLPPLNMVVTSECGNVNVRVKAHSHQARLRPSTAVDGRRRAWCEWALMNAMMAVDSFAQRRRRMRNVTLSILHYFQKSTLFLNKSDTKLQTGVT